MGEEAGEEQGHGQGDASHAEEHEADELAHVQRGVVALGAGVDVPLARRLVLAHDDRLGRHQVAHQDAHHAEQQQVDAHPHEDLPPDGRAAAAAGVGVQQVHVVVVLVDGRVLVAAVVVVEVVQVRLHPEVHRAAPLALRCPAAGLGSRAAAGRVRSVTALLAGICLATQVRLVSS